jgi:hypothetical protein
MEHSDDLERRMKTCDEATAGRRENAILTHVAWISTKEALPSVGQAVAAFTRDGSVIATRLCHDYVHGPYWHGLQNWFDVTHWYGLPNQRPPQFSER